MREQVVKDIAHSLIESVAEVISSSGYLGLLALEESLNEERNRQLSNIDGSIHSSMKLEQLKFIAQRRDALPPDAVIIAEDILYDTEQREPRKTYVNKTTTLSWGAFEDFDDPARPGLVVGTLTKIGETWFAPEIRSPHHAPAQLSVWVEAELRSLSETAGVELLDDEQDSFDAVEKGLSDQRDAFERRADVTELRLAAIRAVRTRLERYGMNPQDVSGLTSAEGAFELVESGKGQEERRHISNLRNHRVYVAISAAEWVRRGAKSWKEAYERLESELKAVDPKASLVYKKYKNLSDAMAETYGVGVPDASVSGKEAFDVSYRREFEKLV